MSMAYYAILRPFEIGGWAAALQLELIKALDAINFDYVGFID